MDDRRLNPSVLLLPSTRSTSSTPSKTPRQRHPRAKGALAALLLAALPTLAGAVWEPPGWRAAAPAVREEPTDPAALLLTWGVRAYRATVSRVDGDRCPSYPTCSAYALEAVGRHGALLGAVLTAGRLLTEADEPAFAPRIFVGGRWQTYAPVADDLAFLRGPLAP